MFQFSAVSQIWKKYIQKLNDWDLPLKEYALALKWRKSSRTNNPSTITIWTIPVK